MKIRFTKEHTGPYGTFVKGREVELPPNMLATVPKDCFVACLEPLPADAKITETGTNKKDRAKLNGKSKTKSSAKTEKREQANTHQSR